MVPSSPNGGVSTARYSTIRITLRISVIADAALPLPKAGSSCPAIMLKALGKMQST